MNYEEIFITKLDRIKHSSVLIIDYDSSWRFGVEALFLENLEGSNLTISSEFESPFSITHVNELCSASIIYISLSPEFCVLFEQDFPLFTSRAVSTEIEDNEVVFMDILCICCITVLVIFARSSDFAGFILSI